MAVGAVHVSLRAGGGSRVEMRYWGDDPNQFRSQTLDRGEIEALVQKSETFYENVAEPDLVAIGQELYRWLDGSDRWLASEFRKQNATTLALLIEADHDLSRLPWEVLHDGKGFLVRGSNPAVLPVRWVRQEVARPATQNRALHVLFMATSPMGVRPELQFEEEEGQILKATRRYPLGLTVEETGTLKELGELVEGYPEGHFDVLHLTGHADHRDEGPRFLMESAIGDIDWVSASQLARAVSRRPALTFLSGCRTAQAPKGGMPSLAEELLVCGFPAVLGWGRPVFDADAIVAATGLYERLATGHSPVEAVLHAHAKMAEASSRHWHLLRLSIAGGLPPALVTAPGVNERPKPRPETHQKRWPGKLRNVSSKVVDRRDFVGRRRPLQRLIRALRSNDMPAGVVVFGLGGVGKSSIACRICDRLGSDFEVVIHEGVLDEPGLLKSLEPILAGHPEHMAALQGSREPLRFRLKHFLDLRAKGGLKPVLLVLDDFEQNLPVDAIAKLPLITPGAQEILEALVWAIEESGHGRCVITSRYRLETSQRDRFEQVELVALRGPEKAKKARALDGLRGAGDEVRTRVDRLADGNPRLMERLDHLLRNPAVEVLQLFDKMEAVVAEFREDVLNRELIAGLDAPTRALLRALLIYELPVPMEAVAALFLDTQAETLPVPMKKAVGLGLLEEEHEGGSALYRVPRILEAALPPLEDAERARLQDAGAEVLYRVWGKAVRGDAEPRALEILRLGLLSRRVEEVGEIGARIGHQWTNDDRYREAQDLYQSAIKAVGEDYRLMGGLGAVDFFLGDGESALSRLQKALAGCPEENSIVKVWLAGLLGDLRFRRGDLEEALRIRREEQLPVYERLKDVRELAVTQGKIADVLEARGDLEEALRIRREEELPVYERLKDVRSVAVTQGQIADVLQARGELEEALRIRREEELPVYERLKDVRELAVTQGKIADVLQARGDLEEALRIRREEQLPVFERLKDVRSVAVTQGQIADVLQARGELEEALRIRREEELPVFERLKDVRSVAVTQGKIADVLQARGELEEALRIRREEELPVFERLKDVRSVAVTQGKIADVLQARGELEEALRIRREEQLPVFERLKDVRELAVTQGKIADVLQARGELEEALRIRREEQLPVFERLKDVRSVAVTQGKIADVLQARGELEEALRIRREEQLPVFERLKDVRSVAVTQGKIADVLQARGDLEEALRIRREEQLPVFERLKDVRELAVTQGKIADVLQARGDLEEALRIRREEQLPVYERLKDVRSVAVTQGKIADVLQARGELEEALRIRREEELPVFERLKDVRSVAVTQGKIADVLQARGELEEALRIRREEQLPVYERLKDVRELAVTQGQIADVLQAKGDVDGALRIWRGDCLPVFRRLNDPFSIIQVLLRIGTTCLNRQDRAGLETLREAFQLALKYQDRRTIAMLAPLFKRPKNDQSKGDADA